MTRLLAVLTIVSAMLCAAPASAEWSVEDMNKTIEQTNFVVDRGCSGTLISVPERLILTNQHCVDGKISVADREVVDGQGKVLKIRTRKLEDVPVEQHFYDGFVRVSTASYVSEIVAVDKRRDLAILRIKGKIPHTYASPLLPEGGVVSRGDKVYIVGNPLGEDATLTEGIISSTNRTFEAPWAENEKLPFYQVSAGIAGGNSGGSAYSAHGFLIGVPAAGYRQATFIGFAIPISQVKAFMRENCLSRVFDPAADDAACRENKKAEDKKKPE